MEIMEIKITEPTTEVLEDYGQVSISFQVKSRFRVDAADNGIGGLVLSEETVERPYVKDYDRGSGNERPLGWLRFGGISHWGVLSALEDDQRVGGAVIAYDTEGVRMLEGRKDLVGLGDMRMDWGFRGQVTRLETRTTRSARRVSDATFQFWLFHKLRADRVGSHVQRCLALVESLEMFLAPASK